MVCVVVETCNYTIVISHSMGQLIESHVLPGSHTPMITALENIYRAWWNSGAGEPRRVISC